MAVGQITEPHQAEAVIRSGQADMVALARGMLNNPRWAWHAAEALNARPLMRRNICALTERCAACPFRATRLLRRKHKKPQTRFGRA